MATSETTNATQTDFIFGSSHHQNLRHQATQTPLSASRTASITTDDSSIQEHLPQTRQYNNDEITSPSLLPTPNLSPARSKASSKASTPTAIITTGNYKPSLHHLLIMATVSLASLTVALDSTILISSLPVLAASLDLSTTTAFWAGSAYLLPYAVVQPFLAALSDIFGRRCCMLFSLLAFLVGSIPCAMAHGATALLAGRVVQGIGGGGVVALSQCIFTDIVPLRERPKWFGKTVLLAWAIGTLTGPVVGGLLSDSHGVGAPHGYGEGWRFMFWINLPISFLALTATWVFVRLQPVDSPMTMRMKLVTVDYVGGLIFIPGLTSLLVALSWGGNQYAWSSWHTIVPLIVGSAALSTFAIWERWGTFCPFMQRSVFPNLSAVLLFTCSFLYGTTLFMALYYVCFYFSAIRLGSPTVAGVDMMAALAFSLPTSIVVGVLMTKLGTFRWAVWCGGVVETAGYGLLLVLDEETCTGTWVGILAVVGIGTGMSLTSLNFGVQTTTTSDRGSGAAAAMYTFLRSTGMCVGVSIGSSVFQNVAAGELNAVGLSERYATDAEAVVFNEMRNMGQGDLLRGEISKAWLDGLRVVWIVMCAVKGLSLLLSLGVKAKTMDRELDGTFKVRGEAFREKDGNEAV
jgi:MFS family permease